MNTHIPIHLDILTKVKFFSKQLQLKLSKSTGRPLAISGEETIALALFKQTVGIPTKKAVWKIFKPKESYKTLCVEMNRFAFKLIGDGIKRNIKMESEKCSHRQTYRLHRCSSVSQ